MSRSLALWAGVLTGPIAWLCSFEARFALAPWACTFQSKAVLFGIAVAALIVCGGSAFLAWREWKALGQHGPTADASSDARATFMAIGGMAVSLGCCMIVIAQTIPEIVLGACE